MTQYGAFLFLKSLKFDWQLGHDSAVWDLIKYHDESILQKTIITEAKEADRSFP